MNNPRFSLAIYFLALVMLIAAGCLIIRRNNFQGVAVGSPQGQTLVSTLSYQWSQGLGMTSIPRLPGARVYRRILIDPGHGGKDPGAQGIIDMYEKDIVLDIGLRLQKILQQNGFQAFITRDRDEFWALDERVDKIKKYQPDLFLSIHANSSQDDTVSGIEVFYAQEEEYWANVHQSLNDAVSEAEDTLPADVPEELYRPDNSRRLIHQQAAKFAKHLSKELASAVGARNRGVKREHFFVLSEASVPAVLVELGFITNEEEGHKLTTEEYRQQLAEALAKGFMNYVEPQQ